MNAVLNYIDAHFWTVVTVVVLAWLARHFGGMLISRLIRNAVHRSAHHADISDKDIAKRQDTLISLVSVIWKWFVIIVATVMIIRELLPQIDLGPLFASAGIIGIAIGFGAQSLIKDFLSGIFIIAENQYRVGDVVDLEGAGGTVEQVGIRSTVVRDVNGNVHYIPNGSIVHVINKTMGFSKINFTLSVLPETDIDKLSETINQVGQQLYEDKAWKDKLLEAPHFLNIGNFTDMAMEVTIVGKTAPSAQWSATGELRRRLLREFRKSHIKLAQFSPGAWPTPAKK